MSIRVEVSRRGLIKIIRVDSIIIDPDLHTVIVMMVIGMKIGMRIVIYEVKRNWNLHILLLLFIVVRGGCYYCANRRSR